MQSTSKRVLVGLPDTLYNQTKQLAKANYKTMSAFIRDCIVEKINHDANGESFSAQEMAQIQRGMEEASRSSGKSWRDMRDDV